MDNITLVKGSRSLKVIPSDSMDKHSFDNPLYLERSSPLLNPALLERLGNIVLGNGTASEIKAAFEKALHDFAVMETTSEATTAIVKERQSSMSDVLFFERLSEQLAKDFARIAASSKPVERTPEDPMAAARILSKGYFHG